MSVIDNHGITIPNQQYKTMSGYTLKKFNSSKKRRTCHSKKYPSDCSANHKRIIRKKAQKSQVKGSEFFISRSMVYFVDVH